MKMTVRSSGVTRVVGDIGERAAPYIQDLSTNPNMSANNIAPALNNENSHFPSSSVDVAVSQHITTPPVDPRGSGRG